MKYLLKLKDCFSGFLVGLFCALIGSALFSIVELIRFQMGKHDLSLFLFELLGLMLLGCMFAGLPAGIGGGVLGLLLRNHHRKGSLTLRSATMTGILLAGIAGVTVCVVGILFIMFFPHNHWTEIVNGYFFLHLSDYLHEFIGQVSFRWPEILAVETIACLAGGWAGSILAKQLLFAKNPPFAE